jgi:hypothetical protein
MPSHYFRRVLVTFEINAAVVCRIFGVHPIIIMRIFRGNLNVILTALTIALIGTTVFCDEKTVEKSAILVCVSMALYFIADSTMYSNATFFLTRTYEGKAYAGNALIYFMVYLCICLMQTKRKSYLLLIGLLIWGHFFSHRRRMFQMIKPHLKFQKMIRCKIIKSVRVLFIYQPQILKVSASVHFLIFL